MHIGASTDASVFSMSGFKPLNYFLAGAITTVLPQIADAISSDVRQWPELGFRQYARAVARTAFFDFATRPWMFSKVTFPFLRRQAMRLDDTELLPSSRVQNKTLDRSLLSRPTGAAMWELRRKLSSVECQLAHRRAIALIYDRVLGDRVVSKDTDAHVRRESSCVHYPIVVDREYGGQVYKSILAQGYHIGLSVYPNIHEMELFKGIPGRSRNVSNLVRSVLTLPTHSRVKEEYALQLAYAVRDAISSAEVR